MDRQEPVVHSVCTGAYLMGCVLCFRTGQDTGFGEEHGSAAWGSPRQPNAQFRQKENKILTRHVRLGPIPTSTGAHWNVLPARQRRGQNPRLRQAQHSEANSNYVITDPKMEVLTATEDI